MWLRPRDSREEPGRKANQDKARKAGDLRSAVSPTDLVDEETGWYRRWYFLARLGDAISLAGKKGQDLTLIYCRLPLTAWETTSSPRLHATFRLALIEREARLANGFFGRLSEEEFAICLPHTDDFREASTADLIRYRVETVSSETSIATFPEDGTDRHSLLEAARTALQGPRASNIVDLEEYRQRRKAA